MRNKLTLSITSMAASCLLLTAALNNASAQSASQYGFQAVSGTYTDITGGTSLSSIQQDDATSSPINIGFTFNFCGTNYTQLVCGSNGIFTFNSSNSYLTNYNSSSSLSSVEPGLMPLWDDVSGGAGTASYQTTGTSPNRVFTLECQNWKWNYGSSIAISFEIKLYETSNKIEYIYRQETGSVNGGSASIGIVDGSGNYLSLNNTSTSPFASSSTFTTSISSKPATGQIYRFTPPAPCSGQPTAGGIDTSSTFGVCSAVAFTLMDTGSTVATGLTRQWQQRNPSSTGTWTNIAGANSTMLSMPSGITSATDFRFIVTCNSSNLSDTSDIVTANINPASSCYCIPTSSYYPTYYYIDSFNTTNAIQNMSTGLIPAPVATNGYSDYTSDTIVAYKGTSFNYTAGFNFGYSARYNVWVDLNHDGSFSQPGELVSQTTAAASSPHTGSIYIPTTADTGVTRLRIRSCMYSWLSLTPCGDVDYGSAVDVAIRLRDLPTCSTTSLPSGLTLGIDKDTLCVSGDINLSLSTPILITGLTYQWQQSPNGSSSWSDIGAPDSTIGTIDTTLSGVDTNTWYRCLIYCDGSLTHTTNTVHVHVNTPELLTYSNDTAKCGSSTFTLHATALSTDTINWFHQAFGGAPIATGGTYTTPMVMQNTSVDVLDTFYVSASTGTITGGSDTVGTGSYPYNYSTLSPFYASYGGYKLQYLIKKSELNAAGIYGGDLTSLAFNVTTGGGTFNNFAISMGMTSATSLSPGSYENVTEVRSPQSVSPVSNSWNNFEFDQPFEWDGVSNVVVQICWSNQNYGGIYDYVKSDYAGYLCTITGYADAQPASAICDGSGLQYYSSAYYRPQMAFSTHTGCENARQPIVVTVHPKPNVDLGPDTNYCVGHTITLHTGVTTAGSNTLWNTSATTDSIVVSTVGQYYATVTNTFGCTSSDTVNITSHVSPPAVDLGDDTSICDGQSVLLTLGYTNPLGLTIWNGSAPGDSLTVTTTGDYYAQVINQWGCSTESDTISITVNPLPPAFNLGHDTSFCTGNSITLNTHNTDPNATVDWNTGSHANSIVVDSTGDYAAIVTNQYGCTTGDTLDLNVISYPDLKLPKDTFMCNGTSIVLDPGAQPAGTTFFWNTGDQSQAITVITGGSYILSANHYGCAALDTVVVTSIQAPTTTGITGTLNSNGSYHFTTNNPSNVNHYFWNFGDGSSDTGAVVNHTYAVAGSYTVTLTVTNNCGTDSTSTQVIYTTNGIHQLNISKDDLELYPNPAIDVVMLSNKSAYQMSSVTVYNVLGQVIYQGKTNNGKQYQLHVGEYASGMYNVKVFFTNGSWTLRRFEIRN